MADIEFKLPPLGENVESGDVVKIAVNIGDTVTKDQTLLEVETGKASAEIPSPEAGVIKQIHVKEGAKVKVGQVLFTIATSAAAAGPDPATAPAQPAAIAPAPAPAQPAAPAPAPVRAAAPPPPATPIEIATGSAAAAAPSTRKFAREIGVDINSVPGSGPGGRVSVDDVKNFSRALNAGMVRAPGKSAATPLPDFSRWGEVERQPLNNVRTATAEQMAFCWNTIPHVTLHDKADITELERLRKDSRSKAEAAGTKLTITAFLVKIVASALKVFPKINSSLDLARGEQIVKKYYNVGVAVDTERGLVVPVLRDVDRRNVIQLSTELQRAADRAKARKLSPDDMTGGCFTVTNLGGISGGFFTPIINHPEVAILGIGRAAYEPVLVDGFFQPRLMLPLSLSFDHRLVDGADGARFLKWVIEAIHNPALLSLEG